MPDNRRNLQVNQTGLKGNEQVDENGWPTPLSDQSNPLRLVVRDGSRGSINEFKAMTTSRQGDVSIPEGRSKVEGEKVDDLTVKVKVTNNNSLGKGE